MVHKNAYNIFRQTVILCYLSEYYLISTQWKKDGHQDWGILTICERYAYPDPSKNMDMLKIKKNIETGMIWKWIVE
jgi:hypothetical protein